MHFYDKGQHLVPRQTQYVAQGFEYRFANMLATVADLKEIKDTLQSQLSQATDSNTTAAGKASNSVHFSADPQVSDDSSDDSRSIASSTHSKRSWGRTYAVPDGSSSVSSTDSRRSFGRTYAVPEGSSSVASSINSKASVDAVSKAPETSTSVASPIYSKAPAGRHRLFSLSPAPPAVTPPSAPQLPTSSLPTDAPSLPSAQMAGEVSPVSPPPPSSPPISRSTSVTLSAPAPNPSDPLVPRQTRDAQQPLGTDSRQISSLPSSSKAPKATSPEPKPKRAKRPGSPIANPALPEPPRAQSPTVDSAMIEPVVTASQRPNPNRPVKPLKRKIRIGNGQGATSARLQASTAAPQTSSAASQPFLPSLQPSLAVSLFSQAASMLV